MNSTCKGQRALPSLSFQRHWTGASPAACSSAAILLDPVDGGAREGKITVLSWRPAGSDLKPRSTRLLIQFSFHN